MIFIRMENDQENIYGRKSLPHLAGSLELSFQNEHPYLHRFWFSVSDDAPLHASSHFVKFLSQHHLF